MLQHVSFSPTYREDCVGILYSSFLQTKGFGSDNRHLYSNMCVTMDSILCPSNSQVREVTTLLFVILECVLFVFYH